MYFSCWGDSLEGLALVALADNVSAQALNGIGGVSHGLDAIGVGGLQLVDEGEYLGNAVGDLIGGVIGNLNARQIGQFFDAL